MFNTLNLTSYDLSVDLLDVHAVRLLSMFLSWFLCFWSLPHSQMFTRLNHQAAYHVISDDIEQPLVVNVSDTFIFYAGRYAEGLKGANVCELSYLT